MTTICVSLHSNFTLKLPPPPCFWFDANTRTPPYLSSPALCPGSGDQRGVTARHRSVFHEHAVRKRLVRGELHHVQSEPRLQDVDVLPMVLPRPVQVHLCLGHPERTLGQGRGDSSDNSVGVVTKFCHQTSHVLLSLHFVTTRNSETMGRNKSNDPHPLNCWVTICCLFESLLIVFCRTRCHSPLLVHCQATARRWWRAPIVTC